MKVLIIDEVSGLTELARRFSSFDAEVFYYNRSFIPPEEVLLSGVIKEPFTFVESWRPYMEGVDIVLVNMPLSEAEMEILERHASTIIGGIPSSLPMDFSVTVRLLTGDLGPCVDMPIFALGSSPGGEMLSPPFSSLPVVSEIFPGTLDPEAYLRHMIDSSKAQTPFAAGVRLYLAPWPHPPQETYTPIRFTIKEEARKHLWLEDVYSLGGEEYITGPSGAIGYATAPAESLKRAPRSLSRRINRVISGISGLESLEYRNDFLRWTNETRRV